MADQFVWSAPDGTTIDFTDEGSGYRVLASGTRGLRSVTYEMVTSKYAGMDGETVDAIRAVGNEITLGLMVNAEGEANFRKRARSLVRAMRPKAGLGTLRVASTFGDVRSLDCYCTGGLEGDESPDAILTGAWWRLALKFYAPDPWWYGEQETYDVGLGSGSSFFPIPPITLAPATVQGHFTVDLTESDTVVYPQWVVTGPGSSLTLTNITTGRVITVNAALAAGETMVIDTRPGLQSVRKADGTNLMGTLDSDPALWPLIDGVNEVSAALTGATTASRIAGVWRARYAGI
jgi:hypothetical protein